MLRGTRGLASTFLSISQCVYKQPTRRMTNGRRHHDVVVQVYGANTDVGKTVISTGLLRAAAASKEFGAVSYIKPLQTGGADAAFVKKHAAEVSTDFSGTHDVSSGFASPLREPPRFPIVHSPMTHAHAPYDRQGVSCHTLFEWSTPSSPHVAAALEDHQVSDDQILSALAAQLAPPAQGSEAEGPSFKLVETAGGVLSPGTLPFVRMYMVGLILCDGSSESQCPLAAYTHHLDTWNMCRPVDACACAGRHLPPPAPARGAGGGWSAWGHQRHHRRL